MFVTFFLSDKNIPKGSTERPLPEKGMDISFFLKGRSGGDI